MTTDAMTRPRRRRGWIIALVVVVFLVAVLVAGELIARSVVPKVVADKVRSALSLEQSHPIDVTVDGGLVLPQVIAGKLTDVHVSSRDVTVGSVVIGEVAAQATGVGFDGEMQSAEITATLTAAQIRDLIPPLDVPIDDLTLGDGTATVHSSFSIFGLSVPLSLTAVPSVSDGTIMLTPHSATLGELSLEASALSGQLGQMGANLIKPWPLCLASSLPRGVTPKAVSIADGALTLTAKVDGKIAVDTALQQTGSCE